MGKKVEGSLADGNIKWLVWTRIYSDIQDRALMKVNGKEYFVARHRNYVVWYKPGKGGDGQPPPDRFPKDAIDLCKANPESVREQQTKHGAGWQVVVAGKTYVFSAAEAGVNKAWCEDVREVAARLAKLNKADMGNPELTIAKMSQVFKVNTRLPDEVGAREAHEWVLNMTRWKEELLRYQDFVYEVQNYAEFYTGVTKAYVDWYRDLNSGVEAQLRKTEQKVAAKWSQLIEECEEKVGNALEIKLFREDVEKMEQYCADCLVFIEELNRLRHSYMHLEGDVFLEQVPLISGLLQRLQALPTMQSIVNLYETYSESIMGGTDGDDKVAWRYKHDEMILKCETNEFINTWDCLEAFKLQSAHYGSIIWNGPTWIWFYQASKTLLQLRYDLEGTVWKRHPSSTVAACDWTFSNQIMKATNVGENPPKIAVWKVLRGNMPPCVILLVASYTRIEEIVHQEQGI